MNKQVLPLLSMKWPIIMIISGLGGLAILMLSVYIAIPEPLIEYCPVGQNEC
jgi:hypothetical protein